MPKRRRNAKEEAEFNLEQVKMFTEDIEWRNQISKQLGTTHILDGPHDGVHWMAKIPGEKTTWDSCKKGFQQFGDNDGTFNDTRCSLYSLYHELSYKFWLEPLVPWRGNYSQNTEILKVSLTAAADKSIKWLRSDNTSPADLKKEYLRRLALL